jgi:flavin reductase (DIM6/NTAB) family NADH-FMN oxidoreductase RutF
MTEKGESVIEQALRLVPSATFVLTSSYEDTRNGVLVPWVQRCAEEPPLISVSAKKGHALEPLIRDSHAFAVCQIDPGDKLLSHKFSLIRPPDEAGDPFDSLGVETLATGAPVLRRSIVALDCEVIRHYDIEADCELYIGRVVAARINAGR